MLSQRRDRILLSHWLPRLPTQQNEGPGNPSFLSSKRWTDPERWKEAIATAPWPWFWPFPAESWEKAGGGGELLKTTVSSALRRCHVEPLVHTQNEKFDPGPVLTGVIHGWEVASWRRKSTSLESGDPGS